MSESQQIEYKKSFGKEAITALTAFANTDGGTVIVGIDDSGVPCGTTIGSETLQRYLNEIKLATYPQLLPKIWVEERDGKSIIIFEVSEYPVKPVSYKNRYYIRLQNSNHVMSLEEFVDLQQQSLSLSYDSYPSRDSISTLDEQLIKRFFQRVQKQGRITLQDDIATNLTKLRLVRDGKPAIAAQLLFGDPDFTIRIGRFKSEATIIDDVVIRAPLVTAVDEALVIIKKHINVEYMFDGGRQRIERWQYPLAAIRELVLNAIVHRDYKSPSDVIIKVFDNRILITNPGKLYGKLRLEDLNRNDYVSSLRNRLLAEMFYLAGDIERYGTGYVRIREYLQEYPELAIAVEEMGDFFKVELRLAPPVTPLVEFDLTGLEIKILRLLYAKPRESTSGIANELDIRIDTVKDYLKRLKAKGVLARKGTPKTGVWILAVPENNLEMYDRSE